VEIKKTLVAATFASAIAASAAFIGPEEGLSLKSYQDSVKVWTICRGHTGPEVKKGLLYTNAMCDALFRSDIWKAMQGVLRNTSVELPEPVLVSFTSFVFNVGEGKYRTSTMRRLANSGDIVGACKQLPRWKFAGGLDCSVRSNNCWGVWERRLREQELCLSPYK
jgi:lysozyme